MIAVIPEWGQTVMYDASAIHFEIIEGVIDDAPERLQPECNNDAPVDVERAWSELQRACRGGA